MTSTPPHHGRLGHSPTVRHGDHWWLTARSGAVLATDPVLTAELDRLAAALSAADRAITALPTSQEQS